MNDNEIVRALREEYKEHPVLIATGRLMEDAAELIERLQKKHKEEACRRFQAECNYDHASRDRDSLRKELAESQSRENAALEINELMTAYECGIDYGLLLAEQERDSEDMFDAAACAVFSAKMCVPSMIVRRRRPRSTEWRDAKQKSINKFFELVVKAVQAWEKSK
jgi:hypothetical protein